MFLRSCEGRRSEEKSNFVQTCNLLSRFIKEKGSLRDLNLEIGGKVESLEAIVKPGSTHGASASTTVLDHHVLMSDKGKSKAIDPSEEGEGEGGQLTIFYSGRVLVFDECGGDKVIAFAKKQSSKMCCYGILSNTSLTSSNPNPNPCQRDHGQLPPRPTSSSSQKQPLSNHTKGGDLPIARRSSLNRFLDKRKDRAAVRGPYHHHHQVQPSSTNADDDEQLQLRL